MRIISLLPSATEILCALELQGQLVGVTHECDHPPTVRDLPKVTTTHIPSDAASGEIDELVRQRCGSQQALYSLDLDMVRRLRPDLIVTQTLCDVCAVSEREVCDAVRSLPHAPQVLNLEPTTLEEVLESIRQVGAAADRAGTAERIVAECRRRIDRIADRTRRLAPARRPRVVVLEWIDPLFTCGHWTPQIVDMAGGTEVLAKPGEKSRMVTWKELVGSRPDVLVVALCGFDIARSLRDIPLLERRPEWRELSCVRDGRVFVTDGNAYFSRPGPRLVDALEMLAHLLHPDEFTLPAGVPMPFPGYERHGVEASNSRGPTA